MMCKVLNVSRGGYYDWVKRPASKREQENDYLASQIKIIFDKEKQRTGAVCITKKLKKMGKTAGKNRVARIMRKKGWRAKGARKFKATTNSNHHLPVAPNLLEQNFEANKPNKKFVSDITYIWTDEGWLYLAVVIDLFSRLVVGWSMKSRITTDLVLDALLMALWRKKPKEQSPDSF